MLSAWVRTAALACVVAVPLLFHSRTLLHEDRTVPWDFVGYHLPDMVVMQEALASRAFPLWDSYHYCGRPFAANPQAQSFYLPRWLSVATSSSQTELASRLEVELLAHILYAALFITFLARRLGFDWPSASLVGVAYGNGCFFVSQLQHAGIVEAGAWLPAAVWAALRLIDSPGFRSILILSGVLVAVFLTGSTPAVLIVYTAAFLFLSLFLWVNPRCALRSLAFFGISCLISAGLVGFQLLPSLELAMHSVGKYRLDWRGTGGGVPWEAFVSLVWPDYYNISDLSRFRLPYEITFCYLFGGFIPLALAGTALYYARASRIVKTLLLALMISVVCMLGDRTGLGLALWYAVPPQIKISYYPLYWIMAFSFYFALLAGAVLNHIRAKAQFKFALVFFTAGELLLISSGLPMNSTSYRPEQRITRGRYATDVFTPAVLATHDSRKPGSRFDIVHESERWVMSAPLLGHATANGYDPLALERVIQSRLLFADGHRWGALYKVEKPDAPMLAALNVDYLISPRPLLAGIGQEWRCVRDVPRSVFVRKTPSSRAHFAHSALRVRSMQEAVAAARNPVWNPRECTIIEEPGAASTAGLPVGEVNVLSYRPGEIRLRTANTGTGFLYVSEAFYPGWRARIDGREANLRVANVALQGLWVPGGTHEVTLRFEPVIFLSGGLVSLCTLIAISAVGVTLQVRKRARGSASEPRTKHTLMSGKERFVIGYRPDLTPGRRHQR